MDGWIRCLIIMNLITYFRSVGIFVSLLVCRSEGLIICRNRWSCGVWCDPLTIISDSKDASASKNVTLICFLSLYYSVQQCYRVKWKVLLQLMGLMSRSLILVLLKSPDAPDLHSKGSALDSLLSSKDRRHQPLFHSIPLFVEWKIFTTQSMKCTCQQLFISFFLRNPIKRKLYCVSISVKHLCANSRLAQMLDLSITCPSNWWDGESCSKAAVLEWQRSEYKYWGPVASGPPQPLFPITSQRGGKVQRIHSPVAQWAEVTFLNPRQYNCIVANSVRTLS